MYPRLPEPTATLSSSPLSYQVDSQPRNQSFSLVTGFIHCHPQTGGEKEEMCVYGGGLSCGRFEVRTPTSGYLWHRPPPSVTVSHF